MKYDYELEDSIITDTDSYMVSHHQLYPPGMTRGYGYLSNRGAPTQFFGLQALLLKSFVGHQVTTNKVVNAAVLFDQHLGPGVFNWNGWTHIVNDHDGKLPLRIRAVPEGTYYPASTVLLDVESTCERCAWLTTYVETKLVRLWYGSTVATNSLDVRRTIGQFLKETGTLEDLPFKLHDFGGRGVSSRESAGIGAAAHLLNFQGTDTVEGLRFVRQFYSPKLMPGFSIRAGAHCTVTAWGEDDEVAAYDHALQYPGLMAQPLDSYNVYHAEDFILPDLLGDVIRSRNGVFIARLDSGVPVSEVSRALRAFETRFGAERNSKHYKVLPPYIRLLQGDGVNPDSIREILQSMANQGWSTDNLAFGMGGALLQLVGRDDQGWAFKLAEVTVNGDTYGVAKHPIGDRSKASRMGVQQNEWLRPVFENGELLVFEDFETLRGRAV